MLLIIETSVPAFDRQFVAYDEDKINTVSSSTDPTIGMANGDLIH